MITASAVTYGREPCVATASVIQDNEMATQIALRNLLVFDHSTAGIEHDLLGFVTFLQE